MFINQLPSEYTYEGFSGINVTPLNFLKLLEYMNQEVKNDIDQFFLDYSMCEKDDRNVNNLLLCDLFYIIFRKKCLTINEDINFNASVRCPIHHDEIKFKITKDDIKFIKLDKELLSGIEVNIAGEYHEVRMPFVHEFLGIASRAQRYSSNYDYKLIKLMSLFPDALRLPGKYQNLITQATYSDVTALITLEELYFQNIENVNVACPKCIAEGDSRGMMTRIDSLVIDMFQEVINQNGLDRDQIVLKQVRGN